MMMTRLLVAALAAGCCSWMALAEPGAVRFPMFLEIEEEPVLDEHEIGRELEPVNAAPGTPLYRELAKYGMRAFNCSFQGEEWSCLLYSPEGKNRCLPMIVNIPGKGEIGNDLVKQFRQRHLFDVVLSPEFQKEHPCHLLSLSPPGWLETFCGSLAGEPNRPQKQAAAMVRKVVALAGDYASVDTNRIYFTGFSFGADGVFRTAMAYPGMFAAVVPIAAIAPPADFVPERQPGNYWYVCNDGDGVARKDCLEGLEELRARVVELGGDFRVSIYPSAAGHDAWTSAWNEKLIWDWMFSKSLAKPDSARRVARNAVTTGETSIPLGGARCSSSVAPVDDAHDETRPLDGLAKPYCEPTAGFRRDDWWQVELEESTSGRVVIVTGDEAGGRILKSGYVELSGNGKTWRRGGGFSKNNGRAEFKATSPFRFLRVRSNQGYKAPFVIRHVQIFKVQ